MASSRRPAHPPAIACTTRPPSRSSSPCGLLDRGWTASEAARAITAGEVSIGEVVIQPPAGSEPGVSRPRPSARGSSSVSSCRRDRRLPPRSKRRSTRSSRRALSKPSSTTCSCPPPRRSGSRGRPGAWASRRNTRRARPSRAGSQRPTRRPPWRAARRSSSACPGFTPRARGPGVRGGPSSARRWRHVPGRRRPRRCMGGHRAAYPGTGRCHRRRHRGGPGSCRRGGRRPAAGSIGIVAVGGAAATAGPSLADGVLELPEPCGRRLSRHRPGDRPPFLNIQQA